ncbi:thyrotropin subunit beta [Chanos chanos]|uniref:Thyrotropin subunit beta n=1 Tax=Chanos chanos TaxID=29144 RepID=A0A6J2UVE6_CHACN|nr:thyrotropin subunit beta-like [Chanos chanos]
MIVHCVLLLLTKSGVLSSCGLENYTLYLEQHECGNCMVINTTICSGRCFTQDTNIRGLVGKYFLRQQSCVHRSVVYSSVMMPGCPAHIDPLFFYPVARRCRCKKCNTIRNECVHKSRWINKCSKHLQLG